MRQPACALALILFALALSGCQSDRVLRRDYTTSDSDKLPHSSVFLKVHMMNGDVYVLTGWQVDGRKREVTGAGKMFDPYRVLVRNDTFSIPFDSVAIFETNDVRHVNPTTPMAIMTGVSAALTIYCITNPKACFGSCPTFYVWDGNRMRVQAESFSASVTPAFEANDIDALYHAKPLNRDLQVVLTNEAMETHVIKYAHLLLAPRNHGNRVFVTPSGEFFQSTSVVAPDSAIAPEGACLGAVVSADGVERFSAADSNDLAAKESIDLTFSRPPAGELGLVLGYRQTLMTTYLFYQALAYMGKSSPYWIADLQRRSKSDVGRAKNLFWGSIGGIDVMVQDGEGKWTKAGEVSEIGPIATNFELVRLPALSGSPLKIRLVMTKGLWRLDYLALAVLGSRVEPVTVQPSAVVRGDSVEDADALAELAGSGTPLVTLPGDRYSVFYRLPEDFLQYEIFMEAKGYYLEWIRREWLDEENPGMTFTMFSDPSAYLRKIAPQFKKVEPTMEQSFWRSKYVNH